MKNIFFTCLSLILVVVFQGCGKTQYELMKEKVQQQKNEFKIKQLKIWESHGYTKEQALPWIDNNISYERSKNWLDLGIWQMSIVKSWEKEGFKIYGKENATNWITVGFQSPQIAKAWKDYKFTTKESKNWLDLGIKNPDLIKNIKYSELIDEVLRQKISIEEYKQWIDFGLIQPDDVAFLKSKGYTNKNIKDKNAKTLLNNMSYEDFMNFMNIKDRRLINTYKYSSSIL